MEPTSSSHRRNVSVRSTRPRSSTKGPLDMPDESVTGSEENHTTSKPIHGPNLSISSAVSSETAPYEHSVNRSFSFLLRQDIYHPLSQLEVPPAFRSELPVLPPGTSLQSAIPILNDLLNGGHFLPAAHLAAIILTSPMISSTDHADIFSLFYTRLACLELCGNTLLAAQEAKALEDLSSSFYYLDGDGTSEPHHIVPWPLRVLAVRLQSIGFGDVRRGITGLYELGSEARKQILRPEIDRQSKDLWKVRLTDLGIRVVNTLVEMGNMEAARRSLANMTPPQGNDMDVVRIILLHLRIGDLETAKRLLDNYPQIGGGIMTPLLSMAEGRFEDATTEWRGLRKNHFGKDNEALITQNLAVCLLYIGRLQESREILESLVKNKKSFQNVTFNLATIYELCSGSEELKLEMTQEISNQPPSRNIIWERPNSDFKIST